MGWQEEAWTMSPLVKPNTRSTSSVSTIDLTLQNTSWSVSSLLFGTDHTYNILTGSGRFAAQNGTQLQTITFSVQSTITKYFSALVIFAF